ncbi:MAG: S8 family serine peptidase [bacterium]|nr:S8 family serine peptidase [bacterium]
MNQLITTFLRKKSLLCLMATLIVFTPISAQALQPNDTAYSQQWYLQKIGAQQAWDIEYNSSQVIIAVIDTGVDINHPDLRDNIWINKDEIPDNGIDDDKNGYIDDLNGWDFYHNVADPRPKFEDGFTDIGINHGTIVAGIIAAVGNNSFALSGVNWQAQIMPLKTLNDSGQGKVTDVIKSIDYAIDNGARIINLSFVGTQYSDSLAEAIGRAHQAGIIVVAAAGNENEQGLGHSLDKDPMYPVCMDGGSNMIIGVAATDDLDQKAVFSNYGSSCIDIAAPGISIIGLSAYDPQREFLGEKFDKYYQGYWSGTSMSAPLVSGSFALLKSINPKLKRSEIINILLSSSDNINRINPQYANLLGAGRLNLKNAAQIVHQQLTSFNNYIVTAPQGKFVPMVKLFSDGSAKNEFNAYGENFFGGAAVATGDIDGDGVDEIITGAGNGGGPHVRIFNNRGELKGQFFAYSENFRGGVNITTGDIDGDGVDEIITGAGNGGGPHVRIFNNRGELKGQFFAYNSDLRNGVSAAAGDIDGDGVDEIITGAGSGTKPEVRVFGADLKLKKSFFAYNENFRGGVNIAAGDVDGNGIDDIITGAKFGGGPHVRVFNHNGSVRSQFFAYDADFRGGVNIGIGDMDNNGVDEIITGAGVGGGPHVRVFNDQGKLLNGFYAYDTVMNGGVSVSAIKL